MGKSSSAIRWVFECMGVVEALLEEEPEAPFQAFQPSQVLTDIRSVELFWGHAEELLRRFQRGEDLRPATMAEIAGFLSKLSLKLPLSETQAEAYWRAFKAALPNHKLEDPDFRELHPGASDEILSMLRRQLAVNDRKG